MPNQTLARRYATAVFQLAEEAGKSTEIQRDLHGFVAALDAEPEIRKFFISPVVDRVEKSELVAKAFAKLDPIALHTMLLIIRKRREGLVDEIVALVARLAKAYHTKFDVNQSVDPDLIGGVRITVGDLRADGTVAGRLDDIARLLSTN